MSEDSENPPPLPDQPGNGEEIKESSISCEQCGAELKFEPGVSQLKCPYCQHEMRIEVDQGDIWKAHEEQDFHAAVSQLLDENSADTVEVHTVKCETCAAETTLDPTIDADECPYCGSAIQRGGEATQKVIRPQGLLPFAVERATARGQFKEWIKSRWFAPNSLKQYARIDTKLQGVYVPHWTYDSDTTTDYTGQRGEYYYETQSYTDSNGNRRTRQVRKTRWYFASGRVRNSFDDLLVLASESLPRKHAEKLEPWDLDGLMPYKEEFLSGFKAENYTVDLATGFQTARGMMEPAINATIRRDIGGDTQRISSKNVMYDKITFKHVLLPVWVSAFRYNNKVFRFLVNARTGEVQGERPWSWVKITLATLLGIALIVLIVFLVQQGK